MTAPTPDLNALLSEAREVALDPDGVESARDYRLIGTLADALAAVTAERDQERERADRAEAQVAYALSVLRTGSIPLGITEQVFKDSLIREACRALSSAEATA